MIEVALDLFKRHGSLHYANVKFGYIILFLSVLHLLFIWLTKQIYLKRWLTSGRSTTLRRLVSIPDTLVLIIWIVLIAVLLAYKFKLENINVFAKRLGRISYTLFPLDIFFSLKPNPLPNIYYLELIFLHKWVSRLVVLLATVHSIAFFIIWLQKGTLIKIFKTLNFLGVIAIFLFVISTFVSLKPIRRRFYKTFFTTHLVIAWGGVLLLQFHARPGVSFYTFLNVVLFIAQIATKFVKSTDVVIERLSNPNSTLEIVQFSNIWFNEGFLPGSHIRLSSTKLNPLTYLLPSHPFTIASRPEDQKISLIIRKSSLVLKTGDTHSLFGPFPSLHNNFFKTADHVVLIAGGSGISYALGMYQDLVKNSAVTVTLVWIVRNKDDLWILDHFNIRSIDIYITGNKDSNSVDPDEDGHESENLLRSSSITDDDFELDELEDFHEVSNDATSSKPKQKIRNGRPNLATYSQSIEQFDKANNWVICCGNRTLNEAAKKWSESLKVRFHSEAFDL